MLALSILAVWYYTRKSYLHDAAIVSETTESLPPPKLFLGSNSEDEEVLADAHVLENLNKYLVLPQHVEQEVKRVDVSQKPDRFTKLNDVVDDEEEEEVDSTSNERPKKFDPESSEITDFIKRREKAEKENLRWIESQREHPHHDDDAT